MVWHGQPVNRRLAEKQCDADEMRGIYCEEGIG